MQIVIKKEIKGILGAREATTQQRMAEDGKSFQMYTSQFEQTTLRHFLMAKEHSAAAKRWNSQSLDGIMTILQADTKKRRNVHILNEVLSYVNKKLPQLFTCVNGSETDLRKLEIIQHQTEPYIVLSELKDVPFHERVQYQPSFSVSPRLMYDRYGFLIRIFAEGIEKWQPRYRKYDQTDGIIIVVELSGFNNTNVVIEVEKSSVIIREIRDDFMESHFDLTHDQLKIPIGPFELIIQIECDIETDKTEINCQDGLFTIICRKSDDVRKAS
ncbi:unnamed protein product [Rotaria socialis]